MSRSLFDPRWTLALGLALASAACGTSDSLLAPGKGRVRFVLDAAPGMNPLAVSSASGAVIEAGPDGLRMSSGSNSGPGSGDSTDSSGPGSGGTDNSGPGNGDGTVYPNRPDSAYADTAYVDRPDVLPYPYPYVRIKSANVTFTSIVARNTDGVFVHVDMDLPVTVDVLTLESGRQIQLPEGELPAGTYDEVVLAISEVEVVLWDDTKITVDPPGGGWTAVVALCPPVVVEEGGTTTISLTLELYNSIYFSGDQFHFLPLFRPHHMCYVDEIPPPIPLEPVVR